MGVGKGYKGRIVRWLTAQERKLLVSVAALLAVGWLVRAWRGEPAPSGPPAELKLKTNATHQF